MPSNAPYSSVAVDVNGSGDNTLVSGVAGQKIRVYGFALVAASAVNAKLKDGSTALTGVMALNPGGAVDADGEGQPLWVLGAGNDLKLNLSSGVQVGGTLWYTQF